MIVELGEVRFVVWGWRAKEEVGFGVSYGLVSYEREAVERGGLL